MAKYQFNGAYPTVYPGILVSGGSLSAEPGDIREFDSPPDGQWLEVQDTKPARVPESWTFNSTLAETEKVTDVDD